jgi:erythromycin esterase
MQLKKCKEENMRKPHQILLLVFMMLQTTLIAMAQQPSTEVPGLELGKPIERELSASDVHSYQVTLAAGQFLRAVVEQRGIDVVVTVFAPDGQKLAEIDSPNGTQGPEPVTIEVKAAGAHRLEIRSLEKEAQPGRYEVKIEELLSAEEYAKRLEAEHAKLDAVKNWLSTNAIPLKTVEAGNGFTDLQPFKKLIGKARLVSLGEATHGTREFFQLKHRMLEFLVSEMNFTVFGIEATMPEAFDINEYVLTGKGDPVKALAGLYFWTWDTEEVLEMIRWMRRYNEDSRHSKKVKFYGFDMQFAPRAVKVALAYLRKVDPEQTAMSEKALALLANPFTAPDFELLPSDKKSETAAAARALLSSFDERKQGYVERSSEMEWTLARQHAKIISQNLEMQMAPNGSFAVRDRSMAENIRWILEHEGPGTKMVVWAHNGHVATQSFGNIENMGIHLRKWYGLDMVVFGFAFNQGSFQAMEMPFPSEKGLHPFTIGPAPEGSLDAVLASAGLPFAVIDLHSLPKEGTVTEWFKTPHTTRSIGAGYADQFAANFFAPQVVPQLYDALFFVEKTASARPVEGGLRPAAQWLIAPANLDFESGEAGMPPRDWTVSSGISNFNFQIVASEENPRRGKLCTMISRAPGKHYGETFGSLQQRLDAAAYRGKKIKLRAFVRTAVKGIGNQAYMWLRLAKEGFGPQATTFYDNMADRPITVSEWREYEIVGDVPAEAQTISYGFALVGDGRAWIDAVAVEVIDK